jgi:WD40 repeat protein
VEDSQHLFLEHFDKIRTYPSQIYHLVLPFSPSSSWLHTYYAAEHLGVVKVVKGLPAGWGTCSRAVRLDGTPQALAYWKDTLAVGFQSGDIIILNALTGSQVAVLSGHTDWVRSLTFSPDGTSLVSGSDDNTLRLWDIQTGGVVKTFHGHTNQVHSVSVSPDYVMIASGSSDKTIRLWDIQTGECHCVIGQQEQVYHVIFSLTNPQHLISMSGNIIQQWDINGHPIGPVHKCSHTAFSTNGTHFVSCRGKVVIVQNSNSGAIVAECPVLKKKTNFTCSCFSPNGRLVAVAIGATVYVWDITGSDPLLIETFNGHLDTVTSLNFPSPSSLVSASKDKLVRFLQIGGQSTDPVAGDPNSTPSTPASIDFVSLQSKNGIAVSSDSDGVMRVWDISTGICKESFNPPNFAFVQKDAQMIDGRLIIVWVSTPAYGIYIMDAEKGEDLRMVDLPQKMPGVLRISEDGSKFFLIEGGFIQAWSMWTGEAVGRVDVEDVKDVLFWGHSLDPLLAGGSRIRVNFKDNSVQVWEFGILGSVPILVSQMSSEIPYLRLIAWQIGKSMIKDMATGKVAFQLPRKYANPSAVRWDGWYLVAGYASGEVLILDFNHLCLDQ